MAIKWTLAELTELDLRMHRSMSLDQESGQVRMPASLSRAEVLHNWLVQGRTKDPEALRLSGIAVNSVSWLTVGLACLSFILGVSAAAALLRTQEKSLINVSNYLGLLIGLQLLMLAGLALSALIFRKRIPVLRKALLPRVVKDLSSPLSLRAWTWKIFGTFQIAGISFNAGVLLLTFWKGLTYDLAFGWATTLETRGEHVHRIVQTLALPWGGAFAPDFEQILHSRIRFATDLNLTDSASTAAWWPFLMMCVLFYGLLPRLLLACWGACQLNRVSKNPDLDSPETERLFLSLTRKPLVFSGDEADRPLTGKGSELPDAFMPETDLRLHVDEELLSAARQEAFAAEIENRLGLPLDPGGPGVLKVIELWQPPLEETLRELRTLRESLGKKADLLILGVGFPDPAGGNFFLPPEEGDLKIWRQRLSELKDPHLGLTPWRART